MMFFDDNIAGTPAPLPGLYEALTGNRAPDAPQFGGAALSVDAPEPDRAPDVEPRDRLPAAPQGAGNAPDHDAILEDALRAARVPPHRLDSGDLVAAANLMAKECLPPADAYERVVMQSARDCGLCGPELQEVYGPGAGGKVGATTAPQEATPNWRDASLRPAIKAPMNEGRETGPLDSGASRFDPGVRLAEGRKPPGPDWHVLQEILRQLFRALKPQQPPAQQQPPPQTQPSQPQAPALQSPPQQPSSQPPAPAPQPQRPQPG
jgi:hypothetical protein